METQAFTQQQKEIMKKLYTTFKRAIISPKAVNARQWLKKHALSEFETGAGFISYTLHLNKPEEFKRQLEAVHLLRKHPTHQGRKIFGGNGIVFPLKDKQGDIVNLYTIEIESGQAEYLSEEGLYPGYPSEKTKQLYLTKNITDAATIIECQLRREANDVLALHKGKLLPQHLEAIQSLTNLQEIIIIE